MTTFSHPLARLVLWLFSLVSYASGFDGGMNGRSGIMTSPRGGAGGAMPLPLASPTSSTTSSTAAAAATYTTPRGGSVGMMMMGSTGTGGVGVHFGITPEIIRLLLEIAKVGPEVGR